MDIFNIMSTSIDGGTWGVAIFTELFLSLHMSAFLLFPLANMFAKEGKKWKLFWILFAIRVVILLIIDCINPMLGMFLDVFIMFLGAFLIVPIVSAITKKSAYGNIKTNLPALKSSTGISATTETPKDIICPGCGAVVSIENKFCNKCGKELPQIKPDEAATKQIVKEIVKPSNFDNIFSLTEEEMVKEFIKKEMERSQIDIKSKLIPSNILRRKKVLNIIFCVLLLIYISMIFFHYPILTYIIGFIILLVLFIYNKKFDIYKYLEKEVKSRPNEKISNIVMQTKTDFVPNTSRKTLLIGMLIAIILPLIYFFNPRIIYEKVDGGYAVRYYIYGLSNFTTATIPEKYNGEDVVSLRGNTFSNMFFLEEVNLPDTITEIRGQAFKNCISLKKVNIPNKLEYLGGGAFQNATSIESIVLPDTLTELGGESFSGARSLKSITLSNNLTEIRGNTFEDCTSLTEITIPDKVTRIGGHAFHGDYNLSKVNISNNSKLREIGSSAFRDCKKLSNISIPEYTYVNERAFKNSGTYIDRFYVDETNYNNTNNTTDVITPNIKDITTSSLSEYIEYGNKVTFLEHNMVVNYDTYTQDDIAWLTFDYNGISRKISYDTKYKNEQYYAFDNYVFYIKGLYKSRLLVMVTEVKPKSNEYNYYISKNISNEEKNATYYLKSNYITGQYIVIDDITIDENGEHTLVVDFIGDINEKVTFTDTNNTFTTENLKMVIDTSFNFSIPVDIYLK